MSHKHGQHEYQYDHHCGAMICVYCNHHQGMVRCYCGWPNGRGREELEALGERIEDPEPIDGFWA